MQLRSRKIGSTSSIQGGGDGDGLDEIDVLHSVSDSGTEDVVPSSDDSGELSAKKKSGKKRQTKRFKRGEQSLEEKVGNDVINDENENKLEQGIEGAEQENEGLIDENSEKKVENDAAEDGNTSNEEGIEDTHSQEIVEKKKRARNRKSKPVLLWNVWEQENERWIDENMDKDFDMGNQNEVMAETVEPPSELMMPLLRYQKEWLAWALLQEDSSIKGGILADEMGMGKTIQAIALVLAKREISRTLGQETLSPFPNSSKDLPMMKATLVICPVVAVSQWVREIERFTLEGSNKVLVYHGPKRVQSWEIFPDYDFVITTYSVVEADYRKHLMPSKYRCPYCSKLFYEKRLMLHLKYICGPDSVKTEKQSKQQTKRSKIQPQMSNQKYGSWKEAFEVTKEQHEKDVKSSSEIENRLRGNSVLHSVKWHRIILDEAHFIKSRQSNTTRAILAISSSYRWALTGTPLQNRIGELYSLVRFLQIVPYSFYFCKDCDCRTLDHSSLSCPDCPHKRVRHFCWWNKYIATPIQDYGYRQRIEGERAMKFLRNKILRSVVLRRTKKGRAADLALPPRIVSLRRDSLDAQEEDYYESLYHDSQAQFNTFVEAGTLMNNFAHIFELLTRLRQAVNHPYLVVYSKTSAVNCGSSVNTDNHEQECGVCHEPVENPVVTSCEHVFCKACLANISDSLNRVSCPSCSKMLTVDLSTSVAAGDQIIKSKIKGFKSTSILNRIKLENFQTSTKIEALREEIRFMLERDGSAKGIVFSQFTSFLDLINYSLLKSDVTCVQLNGSMTLSQRDDAIKRFIEDPDCKIFLMSLKAGGVALNLTIASHVFLMDPWWNPAVERQAQDRIHRIGQYKPIRVVRFIIENSIEERILRLQNKKDLIFDGTIGGSNEALGKLTMEDMRYLFT